MKKVKKEMKFANFFILNFYIKKNKSQNLFLFRKNKIFQAEILQESFIRRVINEIGYMKVFLLYCWKQKVDWSFILGI